MQRCPTKSVRRPIGLLLLWAFYGVACAANRPAVTPALASTNEAPSSPPLPCETAKVAFLRNESCNNDGAVEVCIHEASTQRQTLEQHVGALTCSRSRGRAQCDTKRQINCRMAIDRSHCIDHALSDRDWQRVCQLTQFHFVERVVATLYE